MTLPVALQNRSPVLPLFDLKPGDDVLGMVSVARTHHPFVRESLRTLALLQDALQTRVWVILFNHALRGGPFRLDDPGTVVVPGLPSGAGPSEQMFPCCSGGLMRVRHPLVNRPLRQMVVLATGGAPVPADHEAFAYEGQALPCSVLVRDPQRRDRVAGHGPDLRVGLAPEVDGALRALYERRVLRQALAVQDVGHGGEPGARRSAGERQRVRL